METTKTDERKRKERGGEKDCDSTFCECAYKMAFRFRLGDGSMEAFEEGSYILGTDCRRSDKSQRMNNNDSLFQAV